MQKDDERVGAADVRAVDPRPKFSLQTGGDLWIERRRQLVLTFDDSERSGRGAQPERQADANGGRLNQAK